MTKNLGESGHSEGAARGPKSLRVLLADDDQDSTLMLMMLLREEGDEVRAVYSGSKVMGAVLDFDPDAVILDIEMPGLSGWEAARKIRARFGTDRPLVIGLSGEYKQGSDRILSRILGFNHYLLKPYDFSDLLRLLAPLRYPDADEDRLQSSGS
jgi:DNA-binding response OmpR family regulator